MVFVCPKCRKRVVSDENNKDVIHDCRHTSEVLQKETIRNIGDYTDPDGTTGKVGKFQATLAGIENNAFGTEAYAIDKIKIHTMNKFGKPQSMFRTRNKSQFIEVK